MMTIWDKDNITKDDIIGCASVDITGLTLGADATEEWYRIENPRSHPNMKPQALSPTPPALNDH